MEYRRRLKDVCINLNWHQKLHPDAIINQDREGYNPCSAIQKFTPKKG